MFICRVKNNKQTTAMNYIHKLQNEKNELMQTINGVDEQITAFLSYLASDKFAGFENNYVNASEVYNRLMEIRTQLNK